MKKILFGLFGFLPFVAMAQAQPELFGGADSAAYSPSPMWSVFGWLMLLCMAIWIVVGLLLSVWLWKNINKQKVGREK